VIHPLQYEIEQARHLDCQRHAAQRRDVAEAEKLVSAEMPSAPFLRSVIGCMAWGVLHAAIVKGGIA
jgi:hypothetical protein